ncbi:hypothetical protein D9M68_924790 [compost metagenome]
MAVLGVLGCGVRGAIGIGVGQLAFDGFEGGELLGRAAQDPHRFAAPLDDDLFTRLDAGDIHFNGGARGLGPLGWLEGGHEGHGDGGCSSATHGAGRDQPGSAAAINSRTGGCFTHGDLSMRVETGH